MVIRSEFSEPSEVKLSVAVEAEVPAQHPDGALAAEAGAAEPGASRTDPSATDLSALQEVAAMAPVRRGAESGVAVAMILPRLVQADDLPGRAVAQGDADSLPGLDWLMRALPGGAPQEQRAAAAGILPLTSAERAQPATAETNYVPSDSLFANQWHLGNSGQTGGLAGVDLQVQAVWDDYTGAGVVVGIWDDGVEVSHHDLAANFDPARRAVINGVVHDGLPVGNASHGTAVAGIIAAANNGVGTVGVAFGASFASVNKFSEATTGFNVSESFEALQHFDVTNHSWGYVGSFGPDMLSADPFWVQFFAEIRASVELGRGGLGTININSSGNSRATGQQTGADNFEGGPAVIAVAAVGHDGMVASYSTPGSALLVSGPSGDFTSGSAGIWTTDRTGSAGYSDGTNEFGNPDADYTLGFSGTSAAAPMVSGVVALMLEANPNLGWRDVQDILVHSARHMGSPVGTGPRGPELHQWAFNGAQSWNGGGLHFSNDYGFGMVSAHIAVRLAETWDWQKTSANRIEITGGTWTGNIPIPNQDPTGVTLTFDVQPGQAMSLEHVALEIGRSGGSFRDYRITLTSPDGTVSEVLRPGAPNNSFEANYLFHSNAFWGETGQGVWTVHIADAGNFGIGSLAKAELTLWGSAFDVNQTYFFTEEYADYAGRFGHSYGVIDTNGGTDTINTAAFRSDQRVDLYTGRGQQDQIRPALRQAGTAAQKASRWNYGREGTQLPPFVTYINMLSEVCGARGRRQPYVFACFFLFIGVEGSVAHHRSRPPAHPQRFPVSEHKGWRDQRHDAVPAHGTVERKTPAGNLKRRGRDPGAPPCFIAGRYPRGRGRACRPALQVPWRADCRLR